MDILVAEDDRIPALALRTWLEQLGHRVESVADGEAAWQRLQQGDFQLLMSDWMMPGLDGLELCRRVRSQLDHPYVYIIVVTARDGRDDRLKILDAGADDLLAKPIDFPELFTRLNVARRILTAQEKLRRQTAQLAELHSALEQQNERLAKWAVSDALTGLGNRRRFDEALHSAVSFAERQRQPLSLVLLDVDQFKMYNDAFGHPAGDDVLRLVAQTLQAGARSMDVVTRYGGEEFGVVLQTTDAHDACLVANRMRASIEGRTWPFRPVTASFGISTLFPGERDAAKLIRETDEALYASKIGGRNRVTHYADLPAARVSPEAD